MNNNLTAASETPNNSGAPFTATPHLSENAFYLIVLASLLRKTVKPGALKQLLIPGTFVGYGDVCACNSERSTDC